MSVPIDPADQVECLNGTFEDATHWILGALWTIGGGVANVQWVAPIANVTLEQAIEFLAFHTYQLNFDINTANNMGATFLQTRLFGGLAGRVYGWNTIGHKTCLFQPTEDQTHLRFTIAGPMLLNGEIEIDNVTISDVAIDLIVDDGIGVQPNSYFSSWQVDDEEEILRFTSRFDNTRIYIRKEL